MTKKSPTPTQPLLENVTEKQALQYVSAMCAELGKIAARPRFKMIGYMLDMARLEADQRCEKLPD